MNISTQSFGHIRMAIALAAVTALVASMMPGIASAADTISTKAYLDSNNNGTVETIRWTMDENVTACAYEAGDWTVNTPGSINVAITGLSCTGSDAILNITVTADALETGGATAPVISYNNTDADNSVTLTSGAMTAKASQSITDSAKPMIKTVTIADANTNGMIDSLTYTWTENVDTNDGVAPVAADLPTTLLPDGSTATFGSATISDPAGASAVVTVTGVIGQVTANTAAGSTAISGNLAALWVDGSSNAPDATAGTANETVIDSAAPVVVSTSPADAATEVGVDETISMLFSEAMGTGTLVFTDDQSFQDFTAAWSNSDKTVTFEHTDSLDKNSTYTFTVTAADAAAGTSVALAGLPYDFAFTVEAPTSGGGGGGGGSRSSSNNNDDDSDDDSATSKLEAQIKSLMAQIAALTGGTPAAVNASGLFMMDLDMGATGEDVTRLQTWLIKKGFSIEAGATGYFGAQTQAALAAYQKSAGISPAVGFFGPITRAKANGS